MPNINLNEKVPILSSKELVIYLLTYQISLVNILLSIFIQKIQPQAVQMKVLTLKKILTNLKK